MHSNTLLAPRFLFKYARSSYFPQDRDIVREMWVKGDLKNRLGIRSRREMKQSISEARTETAPMYHDRSVSEISQAGYEPALTYSPGQYEKSPPRTDRAYLHEDWQEDIEGQTPAPNFQYVIDGDPDEFHAVPAGAHLSPNFNMNRHSYNSDSHRLSYYSASDIPAPSPLPSPRSLFYNQEQATRSASNTPLAANMSRSSSALQSPYHDTIGLAPTPPEAVEMRAVRSPPSAFPERMMTNTSNTSGKRAGSRASTMRGSEASHYATASEGEHWDADDDDDDATTINHGNYSSAPHAL